MSRLSRVREAAMKDKKQSFTALMHHLTPGLLRQSFYELKRKAAPGIDGLFWRDYQENLKENISDLHHKLHSGSYKPKPSRRINIPKEDGTQRPLSIQSIGDKIVQQATVTVLSQIYEIDFLGFSYGFRPKRSQHQALDALTFGITKRKVNWVLDLDIRKFFDTVEHDWLIHMLQHRVQDKRLIELIVKWIRVGVQDENGKRWPTLRGVPQGAIISPLLANIYLHYVFDLWSHQWRKRKASGEILIVRYADDAVLCFQHQQEAQRYLEALHQRLGTFGLVVHPEKTRLIRFGRFARAQCMERGVSKPETFDFLGFTHYCTTRRNGEFKVGRKTIQKRLVKRIKQVQHELRRRLHQPVAMTLVWLQQVIRGHLNYYGVPGNGRQLNQFHDEVVKRWLKMLRRRSQRHTIKWEKFGPWVRNHLPKVRIVQPYPEMRFRATYSR